VVGEFSDVVHSVDRALSIIETLSQVEEMGITELSREVGLGKATVYRLVTTLRIRGYIEQTTTEKYRLNLKVFELGNKVVNRLGIRKIAYPYLEKLALDTKETVNLAVLDGTDVYYIDRIESREPLRIQLDIGTRFPAYCTGLGRVLLAYSDPNAIDQLLDQLQNKGEIQKYTHKTLVDTKLLRIELNKIKEQGYTLDDEQYLSGIRCVSAPIFKHTGKVAAALSVAGPTVRMTNRTISKVIPIVKETATNISVRLGYSHGGFI